MYYLSMTSSSLRLFSFDGFEWIKSREKEEWFSSPPPPSFHQRSCVSHCHPTDIGRLVGGKRNWKSHPGKGGRTMFKTMSRWKWNSINGSMLRVNDRTMPTRWGAAEGASLIFAPVGDSWMGFWHTGKNGTVMRTECAREIKKGHVVWCWPNQTELRIWNWRDVFFWHRMNKDAFHRWGILICDNTNQSKLIWFIENRWGFEDGKEMER